MNTNQMINGNGPKKLSQLRDGQAAEHEASCRLLRLVRERIGVTDAVIARSTVAVDRTDGWKHAQVEVRKARRSQIGAKAQMLARRKQMEDASHWRKVMIQTPLGKEIQGVLDMVCAEFQVAADLVLSPLRFEDIVWVRHVAIYLCRMVLKTPAGATARFFGRKDVHTANNAVVHVMCIMETDATRAARVKQLQARLDRQVKLTPAS